MKQPLSDLMNKIYFLFQLKSYKRIFQIPLIAFVVLISGCKNDLEKIHLLSEDTNFPNLSGKNVELFRSDSGKLNMKMFAPEVKIYENVDNPFREFPKGMDVFFFDENQRVKTHISSKYAIYYIEENLYYARDSVVVKNTLTNEWVKSEEMYWDEKKEIVYSDKFSTIQTKDGTYYGREGFESTQDFTIRKLKKATGKLLIDEEE